MAIAHDATSSGNANSTSLTYAHTCTGSRRRLYVEVTTEGADDPVTGVTYAGVAMTQVDKIEIGNDSSSKWQYLYELVAPATGANNVVVSRGSSGQIFSCSSSYTGASQTPGRDSSNKNRNSGTSFTASTTVVGPDCWVIMGVAGDGGFFTPTTGFSRVNRAFYSYIIDSNGTVGTGSQSLAGTVSNGLNGGVIASFSPYDSETFLPQGFFFE